MIDAEFSDIISLQFFDNQDGKGLKFILDTLSIKQKKLNEKDHLQDKDLLSLGNAATGTRVPWIMLSNSILLKQTSSKIEWFCPAIKEHIHYLPINSDLTDIFQNLAWLKSHDKQAREISINAHNFVRNNLQTDDIDSHIAIIFSAYHKIQLDKEIKLASLRLMR